MSEAIPQQVVVFSLGSEEYALPTGSVHEIIRRPVVLLSAEGLFAAAAAEEFVAAA